MLGQRNKMFMYLASTVSAAILFTSMFGSALATATTNTTTIKIPVDIVVFVPCANGGAGEPVELTGSVHGLLITTFTGNGQYIIKFSSNPQGVSGTGLVTGDKYHGTGVTSAHVTASKGATSTFINNFRIIGAGEGTSNNLVVHQTIHMTINADGTVTATVDHNRITCG